MQRADERRFQLFAQRLQMAKPRDNVILPDVISKEPLGPAVRQDDMQWFKIVKWVNFALIDAEELGVGSKTLDDAMQSQKPAVRRLVGTEGEFGKPLGLTNAWAVNAIRAVGNYGEMFDRNVGAHRSSAFRAASTSFGTTAASCTRRRSAEVRIHDRAGG